MSKRSGMQIQTGPLHVRAGLTFLRSCTPTAFSDLPGATSVRGNRMHNDGPEERRPCHQIDVTRILFSATARWLS